MIERLSLIKDELYRLESLYKGDFLFSSVLSVVRDYFPDPNDKELWAMTCALVNKQFDVRKLLIPEMKGLADAILKDYSNFSSFVFAPSNEIENLLRSFSWNSITKKGLKPYIGWSHHFIHVKVLVCFFSALKTFLDKNGSLKGFFKKSYAESTTNPRLEHVIRFFSREFLDLTDKDFCQKKSVRYSNELPIIQGLLIPNPRGNSAFKTVCLFLRWMVRPYPDLDLWKFIPAEELLYPLDSGIRRVITRLGLVKDYKGNDWDMVVNITNAIRKYIDPGDPVRFDFPLSRLGILRICQKQEGRSACFACVFGRAELCQSAIPAERTERTFIETAKTRQTAMIKGEYLELKTRELISSLGYTVDNSLKFLPVESELRNDLLDAKCLKTGLYTEYDVVGLKQEEDHERKYIVVECKYHQKPIHTQDIICFDIKCINLSVLLQKNHLINTADQITKWFISQGNFAIGSEKIAKNRDIKLIDAEDFNLILKKQGLRKVPNVLI